VTEIVTCDQTQITVAPAQPQMLPQPAAQAKGRILFNAAFCRTCRVCELACSIMREGQARPAVARISIVFNEFQRSNPVTVRLCAQCADAPCLTACRVGAMTRDAQTGAVLITEACIGCMRCRKACPWGIPQHHPERKAAIKCDLCTGREDGPACVRLCPLSGKALRYVPDYYERGAADEHV
jgi:anaerobic carbon-monoxide dehydrogenase iron sulfur subunit